MYLFDPEKGNRRRAVIKDKAIHQANEKKRALKVMQRDFQNRSQGLVHNLQGRFTTETAEDSILIERVRSAMGRCCSGTHAISVTVNHGEVTLSGPVMANEITDLIGTVKNVKGVTRVVNNLEMQHGSSGSTPKTSRWTPGECLVAVSVGSVLSIYGLGRRGIVGWLCGAAGLSLVSKGFSDTEHRFESSGASSTETSSSFHRAHIATP
jgi:hypothetical protein